MSNYFGDVLRFIELPPFGQPGATTIGKWRFGKRVRRWSMKIDLRRAAHHSRALFLTEGEQALPRRSLAVWSPLKPVWEAIDFAV